MESTTINWYRSPIERDTLRQLTQKSDLKGWLQAGSFLLLYLALTALAFSLFRIRLWVPMVITCYLQSVVVSFMSLAAAVHELSHGTPFKSKRVNELFLYLFSLLTWSNPVHLRASHIQNHHPYTCYRGRDKEVIMVLVKEKLNWVNWLGWSTFDFKWFALFMRTYILHALGNSDADFFGWDPLLPQGDPRRAQICRWARITILFHAAALAVFIVFHLWVLIYLVVFSVFFGRIIAYLTSVIQHTGLAENTPDWRAVCHTVKLNPVLSYLYWWMNYHTEHHMFAAVPFFNLKKLRKVIDADMPPAFIGLFPCLRLLFEVKRKQETDPRYFSVPDLPSTAAPWKRE